MPPEAVARHVGANSVGRISTILGLLAAVGATQSFHPVAWQIGSVALILGILGWVRSAYRGKTDTGWSIVGILISIIALMACRGMDIRRQLAVSEYRQQQQRQLQRQPDAIGRP